MKTRMHRLSGVILLTLSFAIITINVAVADQVPGQPLLYTPGNLTTDPDGVIIDAYVYQNGGGSDICNKIHDAWAHAITVGVSSTTIDARGFVGTQSVTCTVSPIPLTANGKLLLGNITIPTAVTWVVPAGVEVSRPGSDEHEHQGIK